MTLKGRLANAFSKSNRNKLTKHRPPDSDPVEIGKSKSSFSTRSASNYEEDDRYTDKIDIQTGERRDDTALLHGLAHHESMDSLDSAAKSKYPWLEEDRIPGEPMIARLPGSLWEHIASYLHSSDVASLACSSKTLARRLGPGPLRVLRSPEELPQRIHFLSYLDKTFPHHLLCFFCGIYHCRIQEGDERLKPTRVLNPIVRCPQATKPSYKPQRIRLAVANTLPYAFVQLAMRAHRFGPEYGISLSALFRRWNDRDSNWMIETSYFIHKGRLLVRVVSRCFAAPSLPASAQRHLLYTPREDYTPYFSVCSHWRDGELMNICKCALSHIPEPKKTIAQQLHTGPTLGGSQRQPNPIVSLCSFCRPMRRCPECPTEYLIDLKFAEDKNDPLVKFKQAIVVTRWSDLGDGISPLEGEWAAINGEVKFDSFKAIGKRTISGIFESKNGVAIPGQRLMSLNPKNSKRGEDGDEWY